MFVINNQLIFNIDSHQKAYLNGYLYGISTRHNNEITFIKFNNIIEKILQELQDASEKDDVSCKIDWIEAHSEIDFVVLQHLNSSYYSINPEFQKSFLRGLFDNSDNDFDLLYPKSVINSYNKKFLEEVKELVKVESVIEAKNYHYSLEFYGYNALDFCHDIYQNKGDLYDLEHYNHYLQLCTSNQQLQSHSFKYVKNDPLAQAPYKERASDSGYDLTLIKELKRVNNVVFYDTGISVQTPFGIYFDLCPRSSISKSGYLLANNIGILDNSYRGSIIVPLIKINPDALDLVLPIKLVQIIPRNIIHLQAIEVDTLDVSHRGEGGFGSTNKK